MGRRSDNYNEKPHAMMIPIPLPGHINPFVHLAIKLASNGFTITFVHTQSVHHQLITTDGNDDVFVEARKSGLDIRYKTISDGLALEFDRSANEKEFWNSILHVFPSNVDELVGKLVDDDDDDDDYSPPTCLISDTFYAWPATIANKYKLVNVSLWTESALVFAIYSNLDLFIQNAHLPNPNPNPNPNDEGKDTIDYIPGVQAIQTKDLMSNIRCTDLLKLLETMSYKAFKQLKNADFILFNTVQELEQDTISHLNQKHPIYTIGPILPPGFTKTNVATSLWSETDCTQWLNTKPHGSVLYVSFGSYTHTTKHDIVEIAHGLLLSEVKFIWVLRPGILNSNENDFLPVGFEDRVKDRGLIVPWCYQIDVIKHPAVGGFLTHCGWNSTLESIWCGVPFICFPLYADQFTNRKLVVDDWKIGLNLYDAEWLTREEVLVKINTLMKGTSSNEYRNEMKKVRKRLETALATNGSSHTNFNQFLEDVKVKIQDTNLP